MRAMMIDAKLPKFLWAEAILHAAYVRNRAMTTALTGKTPFVGYEDGPRAIRYFDTSTRRVLISRNYTFVEESGDVGEEVDMDEFIRIIQRDLGDGGERVTKGSSEGDGEAEGTITH